MVRIVIIVLVLWVIVRIARTLLQPRSGQNRPNRVEVTLTRCDHCGLHVPAAEAIHDGGRSYCCEAHRRADIARDQ